MLETFRQRGLSQHLRYSWNWTLITRAVVGLAQSNSGMRFSRTLRTAFLALLFVTIVYALGVGPVAAGTKRGLVSSATFKQVYFPVAWLYDHGVFKKPLEAYCKLWGFP